jgi:hypothetical protein
MSDRLNALRPRVRIRSARREEAGETARLLPIFSDGLAAYI